jgi:general nucleoside transport system ATP-binding protein
MSTPLLKLTGITKRYPGVVANSGVNLEVHPGQIHAVLGENGAGKSTLMKVIYGVVQPDEGHIEFLGKPAHIPNPQLARALGISMVFQHFSLFDTLTVAENVWLGLDRSLQLAEVSQRIETVARQYGLDVDPDRPVHSLSVGEMQRVEIIRALLGDPKLLILDEPTSVLTPQAVDKLFVVLRRLAEEGRAILYISHKLHEIRSLCTHCTVMRGGRVTGECDPRQETNASLSQMMIGAQPPELPERLSGAGRPQLQVQNLSLKADDPFGVDLNSLFLSVCAGEIVGIAGVSGNGQRELLRALSGEDLRAPAASIALQGEAIGALGPAERRRLGWHFVPEERLGRGAVPSLSLAANLLLTRDEAVSQAGLPGFLGWLNMDRLQAQAQGIIDQYRVKANGPQATAKSLSGGNLQKFIVGREIEAKPRVLIVSQPTWGVDVGAAAQIRAALVALRDAGCAVLVVSEELDELMELSDRILVIANGRLSPSIARVHATVDQIGVWMSGLWDEKAMNQQERPHVQA